MLAHLLSTLNHWNHSTFRAPLFPVLHHVIMVLHKILNFNLEKNFTLYSKKYQMHISLFVTKTIFHHLSQCHRVVGVTKLLTKISSVKNYLEYVIFKFMGPFYRVLNICSWGQLIILLWKSLKLDLGKSRLLFSACKQNFIFLVLAIPVSGLKHLLILACTCFKFSK